MPNDALIWSPMPTSFAPSGQQLGYLMSLPSRPRKFVIFALLALLLPAWAVGGLSLVWCVGPNGHSAVETLALNDCHAAPTEASDDASLSAKKGCIDFSFWQRAESPKKHLFVASVSAYPVKAIFGSVDLRREVVTAPIRWDAGSDQLAQHRTVVLLI